MRRLRLKKKISLEELGRHTRLSPALLSKLERDLVMPTLPTLVRVALVLVSDSTRFHRHAARRRRRAPGDRLRFPERPEDPDSAYVFESLDYETTGREMNAYLAEFHQGKASRAHAHDASEFLFVLSGELCVTVEANDHFLAAGDSIYLHPAVGAARVCGRRRRAVPRGLGHDRRARQRCPP